MSYQLQDTVDPENGNQRLMNYKQLIYGRLHTGTLEAAAFVTRGLRLSCRLTFLSTSAGMLRSDVVMVLLRNVPRWTCDIDNDEDLI